MPITPHISATIKKEHPGEVAISLGGKIVAIGENSIKALIKAKKIMPDIEKKEFLVSRIHPKYLAV